MRNHLHAPGNERRLKRLGDGTADEGVHSEIRNAFHTSAELAFLDVCLDAADRFAFVDVDEQQMSGDIEYWRHPSAPCWNTHSHRQRVDTLRATARSRHRFP